MFGDKLKQELLKILAEAGLAGETPFIDMNANISTSVGLPSTIGRCKSLARIQSTVFIKLKLMQRSSKKMRGLNLKPSRVYEIATQQLVSGTIVQPPCWYQTIGTIPPSEIMTRTQPVQHRDANPRSKARKASKLFRPQKIEYPEDRLRKTFFHDHPWELARPRIVLENYGRDGQRCDWSRIQQRTRPLDGER
jgi:hypothetical protein